MKKIKKILAVGASALLLTAFAVSASSCVVWEVFFRKPNLDDSGGNHFERPEMPEVMYTVDENLTGTANDAQYRPDNVSLTPEHPLAGKTIYWLGSSVTYGANSNGFAMGEYLQAMTGCISKKEAVSGTTIFTDGKSANTGAKSYTSRLISSANFNVNDQVDALVCQISTNDAWGDRIANIGQMTDGVSLDYESYDRSTTMGGVEFIIAYAMSTWNCPVYFYSGAYFGDTGTRSNSNPTGTNYSILVDAVKGVADKWNNAGLDIPEVGVIDLYNDVAFNAAVSDEYYKWATNDAIHPRQAGYLQWWTPYFDAYLTYHLTMI